VSVELATSVLAEHVRVECSGEYTFEGVLGAFELAFQRGADAGVEAVLVDIRKLTGRPPTLGERYELAVRVADLQATRTPRIRFAVLGHEPMIHPERFGDVVAARRGASARAFTDEELAGAWLLGGRQVP
jgi:hypothetical protein